jgi:hypothetical protein
MKNKTTVKIGATMGGLIFLSLVVVPACSSEMSIVVGILLAATTGALWFPFRRRLKPSSGVR